VSPTDTSFGSSEPRGSAAALLDARNRPQRIVGVEIGLVRLLAPDEEVGLAVFIDAPPAQDLEAFEVGPNLRRPVIAAHKSGGCGLAYVLVRILETPLTEAAPGWWFRKVASATFRDSRLPGPGASIRSAKFQG
jgi:hypothetical protein